MSPSVYLETTIISYLAARPGRDVVTLSNQQLAREWWEQRRGDFDLFISQFVLDEATTGDEHAVAARLEICAEFRYSILTRPATDSLMIFLIRYRCRRARQPMLCTWRSQP